MFNFNTKGVFVILLSFFILSPFIPKSSAASRYTYKNSEKLRHLIKWRNYTDSAFKEAAKENKPIFLLISAPSWCYFCREYESKDYLFNDQIYPYINKYFIPIYVDSDKNRGLSRKYLQGGWPSTVILSPKGKKIIGWAGVLKINDLYDTLQKVIIKIDKTNKNLK